MKVQPDNHLLPYYFGRVLAGTNKRKSISLLESSVRLNEKFQNAYYELGKTLAANGDQMKAIQALKRCLQLNSNLLEAHYQLGGLHRKQEQQSLASERYEAVRKIRQDEDSEDTKEEICLKFPA